MTFAEAMKLAEILYFNGEPVVLTDKDGTVIHGEESLKAFGPERCRIIPDIDLEEWNAGNSPQILESARKTSIREKLERGK